ncbi:MAG: site-2 protease family protein [Phycisphaerae bacterium]|jgi:Zn-dependent protease|nr:site-2 protease family protein [Phycisphaerae bacterium]
MNLEIAKLLLPGLIVGLSLHECAHAWSASLLGDNFARRQGRVSLNPFRHMSILGTLAILFLPMGWGKPVQVNLYNFKHPKRDFLISSLAGPLANVVVVIFCIALAQVTRHDFSFGASAQPYVTKAHTLIIFTALINGIMATFNLLPIPPLDGSKIWPFLFPRLKPSFGGKGFWIFLIAIMYLLHNGHLKPVFDFAIHSTTYYMPSSDSEKYEWSLDDGHAAIENNKLDLADKFLSNAIELNPRSHLAFYWRAIGRTAAGRHAKALDDMDRAVELSGGKASYIEYRKVIEKQLEQPSQSPGSQPAASPALSQ